jgi:hypothetical protein
MASVRHLYSLAIGLLLGCWMLGDGMLHPVGVSLVAWVLIRVGAKGWLPANVVSMLVFVWAFGMLGARRQLRQQQQQQQSIALKNVDWILTLYLSVVGISCTPISRSISLSRCLCTDLVCWLVGWL